MGVVGISKDTWAGTPDVGFETCPVGAAQVFEIVEVIEGLGDEKERVDVVCATIADDGTQYKHREFLRIYDEKGLGWAKKFLCSMGRGDICKEDADWQDLLNTEFTADVSHRTYQGNKQSQLQNIQPQSHTFTDIPADGAPDAKSVATPAAAAGRPARGKAPR